jgi:mycoredoxin
MNSTDKIILYGTSWCGGSHRARTLLEQKGVPYQWVDIDKNSKAREFVEKTNRGFRSVPTIVFPDGSILVEPSTEELSIKVTKL